MAGNGQLSMDEEAVDEFSDVSGDDEEEVDEEEEEEEEAAVVMVVVAWYRWMTLASSRVSPIDCHGLCWHSPVSSHKVMPKLHTSL